MCLKPVESNALVGEHDHAAQKAPEWDDRHTHYTDRQTDAHTICPLDDDLFWFLTVHG